MCWLLCAAACLAEAHAAAAGCISGLVDDGSGQDPPRGAGAGAKEKNNAKKEEEEEEDDVEESGKQEDPAAESEGAGKQKPTREQWFDEAKIVAAMRTQQTWLDEQKTKLAEVALDMEQVSTEIQSQCAEVTRRAANEVKILTNRMKLVNLVLGRVPPPSSGSSSSISGNIGKVSATTALRTAKAEIAKRLQEAENRDASTKGGNVSGARGAGLGQGPPTRSYMSLEVLDDFADMIDKMLAATCKQDILEFQASLKEPKKAVQELLALSKSSVKEAKISLTGAKRPWTARKQQVITS